MAQDAGVKSIPELRHFGRNLSQASQALTTLFQTLNSQMHSVCDNWDDTQAQKFIPVFEQSKREIDKISQEMQHFSEYLNKLSDAYERVKDVRL